MSVKVVFQKEALPPNDVVAELALEKDKMEVVCWYEGPRGISEGGAAFMQKELLTPLFLKCKDLKLFLYSLKGWDFSKTVSTIKTTSPLGDAINKVDTAYIECTYSASFFKYCLRVETTSPLYQYVSEQLPKKEWLCALSEKHQKSGKKVADFFEGKSSLLSSIYTLDVAEAYSQMQYMEGYFLIRGLVEKALNEGRNKVRCAFVLPNDEDKYYKKDYPEEIQKMLSLDFGTRIQQLQITISFNIFLFGDSLARRPYIDKNKGAKNVRPKQITSFLPTIKRSSETLPVLKEGIPQYPKDIYHHLNSWVEGDEQKEQSAPKTVKDLNRHIIDRPQFPKDIYHGL